MLPRQFPRAVMIAVAIFVAADLAIRIAASAGALPRPGEWPAPEAEHKVEQMASWRGNHGPGGIAIVGDSTVDDGIDPTVLEGSLGRGVAAYNAALAAEPPDVLAAWTEKIVEPRLRPRTVVLGATPALVNANIAGTIALAQAFRSSGPMRHAMGTERVGDTAQRVTGDVSALFRYRRVLRRPTLWTAGRHNGAHGAGAVFDPPLSRNGMALAGVDATLGTFQGRPYNVSTRVAQIAGGLFHKFQVGAARVDDLRALISRMRARGVSVLVVSMPISPVGLTALPRGEADLRAATTALQQAAAAGGAAFVDGGVWDGSLFGDPIHLNGRGAARLSAVVAAALGRM